jgi:hypothetical protein
MNKIRGQNKKIQVPHMSRKKRKKGRKQEKEKEKI